jgi:hypothetical protein
MASGSGRDFRTVGERRPLTLGELQAAAALGAAVLLALDEAMMGSAAGLPEQLDQLEELLSNVSL